MTETTQKMSVGVALVTLNASRHLSSCLTPVLRSSLKPRVVVVDSSSTDGTPGMAAAMGAEVIGVRQFNHGGTRELARKYLGTDIVVMLTQDAYLADETSIEKLVAPLQANLAAVSYARQIPHASAGYLESFPRHFNYPAVSERRSISDIDAKGAQVFFCSNACAAWNNYNLDEIGGFETVLTHEDTFAVARLLARGYSIAYVAEAEVRHSHRHSLSDEFRRYFDAGWARAKHRDLFQNLRDERRGMAYATALLKAVAAERPLLLPSAFAGLCAKYAGYRCGEQARDWPARLCARLSGQPYYWGTPFVTGNLGFEKLSPTGGQD